MEPAGPVPECQERGRKSQMERPKTLAIDASPTADGFPRTPGLVAILGLGRPASAGVAERSFGDRVFLANYPL